MYSRPTIVKHKHFVGKKAISRHPEIHKHVKDKAMDEQAKVMRHQGLVFLLTFDGSRVTLWMVDWWLWSAGCGAVSKGSKGPAFDFFED